MKVPTDWRQITLKQFIELQDLPETSNEITKLINQVAVLTNKTPEEVRNLQAVKLNKIGERLKFIEHLPKEKKPVFFYHKFRLYRRQELNYTTVAQVTDILTLNANEKNVGRKILNALAVVYYKGRFKEYDSERFNKTKAELENLNFATAFNVSSFFFHGLKTYLPGVLSRYFLKLTASQIENLTQTVGKIGSINDWNEYVKYTNGTISQ